MSNVQFPTAVPVNVFNKISTHCDDFCYHSIVCHIQSPTSSGTRVRADRGSGCRLRTAVLQCVTLRSSDSSLFLVPRL